MEATLSTSSTRHVLQGQVMVDRAWGRTLGVHQAKGARRVGNFYKVPRAEYLQLIEAQARLNPEDSPCFDWTPNDDQAVAELLESSHQETPCSGK